MHYTFLTLGFLVLNTLGSFGQNMRKNLEKKIKIDLIAITREAIEKKKNVIKRLKEMENLFKSVQALDSLETKVIRLRKDFMSKETTYLKHHQVTTSEFNSMIIDKMEARHKEVAEYDFKNKKSSTFEDIERELMISEVKLFYFNSLKIALNEEGFYPEAHNLGSIRKLLEEVKKENRALENVHYKLLIDVGLEKLF